MFNRSAFNVSAFNADDEDEDGTESLSESIVASDEWEAEIVPLEPSEPLTEIVRVSDTHIGAAISRLVDSVACVDGLPTASIITPLREAFRLSVLAFGRSNYTVAIKDAIRLRERTRPILSAAVNEIATLADTPAAQALITVALVEALIDSGVVAGKRDAVAHIALAMALAESTTVFNAAELAEALLTDDAFATNLIAKAALVDALLLVADVLAARIMLVALPEGLLTAEALTGRTIYSARISDFVEFDVEFILGGEIFQGWVINTESGAPTEYENYPFNSMCRLGQRYYGAAENGLFLLDGADDAGEPISARILTGEMDFDSPNLKRMERAYLGYTTRGDLVLKVIVSHAGKRAEYWYKAAAMTTGERTETRVKIGEGIVSRYWQFELCNTGGEDFEVDRWDFDVRDLKRRV